MSIINQMLRDLEKRRPQSVISGSPGAIIGPQGAMNGPQGIVGNILPTPTAKRGPLHSMLWALPLLAIGLSVGMLILRPSTLEMMTMTSLANLMPVASIILNPSSPIPPASLPVLQSSPLPSPSSLATPEPGLVAEDNNAIPHIVPPESTPQPITPTPILQQPSIPTPEITVPPSPPPRQAADLKKEPQHITSAPRPPLPENQVHGLLKKTADVTIFNKHIKQLTPAQQAENEYRKAVGLLQQGRMARAMESLAQALQLDGSHVAARQTLVGLLVEEKRFGEAEQRLQEGLKVGAGLDINRPGLVIMLARLQVERGDVRTALETLQLGLPNVQENAVEHADYQAFLAALLQREGRHGEAIGHYLKALRKMPQPGIWLMGIGISLQAENRLQDAQEAFHHASASNTLSPDLQAFVEQRLKQIKR